MSDFLFLFRGGRSGATPSPEDMQRSLQKWGAWIDGLAKAGTFKAGEPLEGGGKVVSGSKKLVTDGPFVESKEVVGGYFIVNARNLDDATEISKGCPILEDGGSVEIRSIKHLQM
jgi:hypothetical protein